MKVAVAKIPSVGMDFDFYKGKEWVVENLNESDELKDFVIEGIKCKCHLKSIKDQILIDGEASINLRPTCFRCLKEFERNYTAQLRLTCLPDVRKKSLRGEDYMDGDVGVNYYTGPEIDLAKIAKEQVLLNIPMNFLCSENCKGLCSKCGQDLNRNECKCDKDILKDVRS